MSSSEAGGYHDMSESDANSTVPATQSKWGKWLGIGCGGVIVLSLIGLIALNWGIKRVIVGKIETGLEAKGWKAEIGGFDYSIASKEVKLRDFVGVPTDAKQLAELGEIQVAHARVQFDTSRNDKLGALDIRGAQARFGKLDELKLVPDKSIAVKGLVFNNPAEFGGGPLLDFKEIRIEYGPELERGRDHFKVLHMELSRLNIVKNKQGLWLTDLSPKAQDSIRNNDKGPTIDRLTIQIGEIAFQDLSVDRPPQVIPMNRTIQVDRNPKDYALGVFFQLVGVVAEAKRKAGY